MIHSVENVDPVKAPTSNRAHRREHMMAMERVQQEAKELRRSLLETYTGERLRRTFNWTLGSTDDDVSMYTKRLTEMELHLFQVGSCAALAHDEWKIFGSRRIPVCSMLKASQQIIMAPASQKTTNVTPDKNKNGEDTWKRGSKRQRVA